MTGQENQTLFDVEWTEADRNYVQEMTAYYRQEDLEVTFVGGVFMGNETDVYNSNPFTHRRMTLVGKQWITVPIYPFAKAGFEPIDPTGRFAYYKSGAFKEYWDDASQNFMQRMLLDGTALDVIKPIFGTGIAKLDTTVIVPGAFVGMPPNASVVPYSVSPNLAAAYNAVAQAKDDMSDSTQDPIMNGQVEKGVTAYATSKAEQNARIFLGVFGAMLAQLVSDVGELTMDCVMQHATVPELDASVPDAVKLKYKTFLSKSVDKGKNLTNRIVFDGTMVGRDISKAQQESKEWQLFNEAGGYETDQRIWMVNPYQFVRNRYNLFVDADQIVSKSMGTDQQRAALALEVMTNPVISPYLNMQNVVEDFAVEPFAEGDPGRYMAKTDDLMRSVMGNNVPGAPAVPSATSAPLQVQPTL